MAKGNTRLERTWIGKENRPKLEPRILIEDSEVYWQQGRSTEADFIYVTTQFMSKDMLAKLSDEVGPNRSLLICCGSFRADVSQFENLTVKKTPKAVLKKCEWGHDGYSLEIENLPDAPPEMLDQPEDEPPPRRKPTRKFGKGRNRPTSQPCSTWRAPDDARTKARPWPAGAVPRRDRPVPI